MLHVLHALFPLVAGVAFTFVALWISKGHSESVRKVVVNDLERSGHKQLHLAGIYIDTRPPSRTLSYRNGSVSAKLKINKVKNPADGKKRWQLFQDLPTGERRIVSPANLEQLINDVAATHKGLTERTTGVPADSLISVI